MSVLNSPEELEYATREIAEAAIQKNAKQQGYAVARNKLYNDKRDELRRHLQKRRSVGLQTLPPPPDLATASRPYHLRRTRTRLDNTTQSPPR